ncbi:MAG: fasciclin domain-containing protein [Muribaculum sp.]|nr:fasciclin domain-containing protein [Muribaculum sp.]
MKNLTKIFLSAVCGVMMFSTTSCTEEVADDALYTFTGQTVASYVDETDGFSMFRRLMDDTDTRGLLSTYGHYTCFLPTDAAFDRYFEKIGVDYDRMSDADKKELIYNHIIMSSSIDYTSDLFENGALPAVSMSTQKINLSFEADETGSSFDIFVNSNAVILERDIEVHNGVIHTISNIIYYPDEYIADIISQYDEFSLFTEALIATGVDKLVNKAYDETYVPAVGLEGYKDPADPSWDPYYVPQEKRLSYTCFAEPNSVYEAKGITTLAQLQVYAEDFYGTEDRNDLTSERNALNKFVRYHILDRMLGANEFFRTNNTVPTRISEVEEFYPTLYTNRLVEIKNIDGGVINFRNRPNDVSRVPAYVRINPEKRNISAINAYIHALDDILVYDEDIMRQDVLNRRIRTDISNLMPECVNNYYRWSYELSGRAGVKVPGDGYSDYFSCTDLTRPYMTLGWGTSYHGVQFYVRGWFDYELSSLPIPPGEWEFRIGYIAAGWYGIAQVFLDGEIQGIPVDLAAGTSDTDMRVGWEEDTPSSINRENDKAMRNRGYMKGPHSEWASNGKTMRETKNCLRAIIGRVNATEYGRHTFRSKNIYSDGRYFVIEYIELIPTSQIENEDIF